MTSLVARLAVVALAATALGSCVRPDDHVDDQSGARHVLLVSLDTLRADHLGSWGYSRPTSPFLDELAARGTRFSQAFVNTHGTPPSHASLFSSLYQETHGVSLRRLDTGAPDKRLPNFVVTLPELFQKAGFATVGTAAGGYLSEQFNFQQGFDEWDSRAWGLRRGRQAFLAQVETAAQRSDRVFAFFHTYEIHSPYTSPFEDPGIFGQYDSSVEPINDVLRPIQNDAADHLETEDFRALEAAYDVGIRYADEQLRLLFADLDEIGFLEHALVVITSDHGEEFGEHGGVLHPATLYDELVHVPLLLAGPGVAAGRVDGRLVSTVDVAPTVLGWAGLGAPPFMEGRNLLEGYDQYEPDSAVFSQYRDVLYSIRTEDWKLVSRRDRSVLYDLRRDPGEHRNAAKRHPEVKNELERRLRTWRDTVPPMVEATDLGTSELTADDIRQLKALGYVD